ncbi:flagellar basal body P-ring formation chaperone FlgA [Ferrimonas marina]|uniref:Flagella basal body P-ring formation protein FlgA n=1 Tax=Ferrimonas marina TaxID=299255 RepID=A0A1M5R034_9GAMM|nr:flagellar basal body P-ring formation chaperone FlgA [Ferrimonas marina]SHH19702.1 flagella basal body P-ring formation protein FlgA [Ferrimonas marina]
MGIKGRAISAFFAATFLLLPLQGQAETEGAKAQIEQAMMAQLKQELATWQRRSGAELMDEGISLRLPSSVAQLAPCPTPLEVEAGRNAPLGHQQRQIRCEAEGWRLFVRARVEAKVTVPVTVRRLGRGHRIERTDLVMEPRVLGLSDQDLVFAQSDLVGQSVRRSLRPGQPVRLSQISPPYLVAMGDEVVIQAGTEGFAATMTGTALDNGSEGQAVRVRNNSSGQVITAYPVRKGVVATRY